MSLITALQDLAAYLTSATAATTYTALANVTTRTSNLGTPNITAAWATAVSDIAYFSKIPNCPAGSIIESILPQIGNSPTGFYRVALYDGTQDQPQNLIAESGTIAVGSVGEFAISDFETVTDTMWYGFQLADGGAHMAASYDEFNSVMGTLSDPVTYGSFPSHCTITAQFSTAQLNFRVTKKYVITVAD